MLSAHLAATTGATIFVGAFVQGLTSFGYAVVAWSVWGVLVQSGIEVLDYHTHLVCLTCFACSTISVYNLLGVGKHVAANLPAVLLSLVPELPGNLAGVWLSRRVPVATLRLLIGALFVVMSLPRLSTEVLSALSPASASADAARGPSLSAEPSVVGAAQEPEEATAMEPTAAKEVSREPPQRCAMPESSCSSPRRFAAGLLLTSLTSGFCHGSVGIPGPPWMLYFAFVGLRKADARSIFATFELVGSINFLIGYSASGELKRQDMPLYALVVVMSLVGSPLGNLLHHRVSEHGATMSLLLLALVSGLQALRAFDASDHEVGPWVRMLAAAWGASLLARATLRHRAGAARRGLVPRRAPGHRGPRGREGVSPR